MLDVLMSDFILGILLLGVLLSHVLLGVVLFGFVQVRIVLSVVLLNVEAPCRDALNTFQLTKACPRDISLILCALR